MGSGADLEYERLVHYNQINREEAQGYDGAYLEQLHDIRSLIVSGNLTVQQLSDLLGDSGVRGPEGPEGPQGPEGPEGPIGPRGNDGDPVAVLGEKDTVNDLPTRLVQDGDAYYVKATERLHIYYDGRWDISTPWRGPVGPEGPEGPQGLQGLQGTQGEQGEQGEVGPQGDSFDYDWNGTELGVR